MGGTFVRAAEPSFQSHSTFFRRATACEVPGAETLNSARCGSFSFALSRCSFSLSRAKLQLALLFLLFLNGWEHASFHLPVCQLLGRNVCPSLCPCVNGASVCSTVVSKSSHSTTPPSPSAQFIFISKSIGSRATRNDGAWQQPCCISAVAHTWV